MNDESVKNQSKSVINDEYAEGVSRWGNFKSFPNVALNIYRNRDTKHFCFADGF